MVTEGHEVTSSVVTHSHLSSESKRQLDAPVYQCLLADTDL